MADLDLSRPSVRRQLAAIITRAEVILEAELAAGRSRTVDIAHSIHVTGIAHDYDVDILVEVAPRAKLVFGVRMSTYRVQLDGEWAAMQPKVKESSGRAALGLGVWIERKASILKWAADGIRAAALYQQSKPIQKEAIRARTQ